MLLLKAPRQPAITQCLVCVVFVANLSGEGTPRFHLARARKRRWREGSEGLIQAYPAAKGQCECAQSCVHDQRLSDTDP